MNRPVRPVMPSLLTLGLGADADEREVRRAYARRVKAIDPATDPGGFQTLREHYEAALAWVRVRARADLADEQAIEQAVEPQGPTGHDSDAEPPVPAVLVPPTPAHRVAEPTDPTPPAAPASAPAVQATLWTDADGQVFSGFADAAARGPFVPRAF